MRAKTITFDVTQEHFIGERFYPPQYLVRSFLHCRHCTRSKTFVLYQRQRSDSYDVRKHGLLKLTGALNGHMSIDGYISLKDAAAIEPPDHLPERIAAAFTIEQNSEG